MATLALMWSVIFPNPFNLGGLVRRIDTLIGRLILSGFGTYTGGLNILDEDITNILGHNLSIFALLDGLIN